LICLNYVKLRRQKPAASIFHGKIRRMWRQEIIENIRNLPYGCHILKTAV